jgi:ribosomal protein S18 acetylase RimI-like enzyme
MLERVSISNVAGLEAVGKETYRQHFSEIWSPKGLELYLETHFNREVLRQQLRSASVQYYFPLYNGEISGMVKVKTKSRIPSEPYDDGFELEKIYLLSAFTGLGLGKKIISEFAAIAKIKNERFLWLDVLKTNTRAKKLYEEAGFSTVGDIPFSTDILKIDMWIMRMDI